jgi:hypothetical protein
MFRKHNRKRQSAGSLINFEDFVRYRADKEKIITVTPSPSRILFRKTGRRQSSSRNFSISTNLRRAPIHPIPPPMIAKISLLTIAIGTHMRLRRLDGTTMRIISSRSFQGWQKDSRVGTNCFKNTRS